MFQLNRSDSDSAMSLRKRLDFQRSMLERRSLRVPRVITGLNKQQQQQQQQPSSSSSPKKSSNKSNKTSPPSVQTPLDLELDLAAQQSKLRVMQEEIDRLKDIKGRLEEAKTKGELPTWLQEHERFQQLLTKVQTTPCESS